MANKNVSEIAGKVWAVIKKNKFVMAVLLIGLVLILLPTGTRDNSTDTTKTIPDESVSFSLAEQEARIAEALSRIDGAGKVTVVLALKSGAEQVVATDESVASDSSSSDGTEERSVQHDTQTVIINVGSSQQKPVTLKVLYPEYRGALIVAEGADAPAVKLALVQAVAGLTGLGTDKIVVTKMNQS